MSNSPSFIIKKSHFYLATGGIAILVAILLFNQNTSARDTTTQNPSPTPTETVFVPTQGINYNWNNDSQNQLNEIRAQNCRLSQDLMMQSLDLSRQASELEWESDGLSNFDQIQNLRNQSVSLLVKSQELGNDC